MRSGAGELMGVKLRSLGETGAAEFIIERTGDVAVVATNADGMTDTVDAQIAWRLPVGFDAGAFVNDLLAWAAANLDGFRVAPPPGPPWEPNGAGARLLPHRSGTDGMFVCTFRRG